MMPALEAIKGYALLLTGALACPCHWPLWIGLASGTALGGLITENLTWFALAGVLYFTAAIFLGFRFLGWDKRLDGSASEEA